MKNIGFIGTGVMGKSMVRNLMKKGFHLRVYNRTKEKALELEKDGALVCDTIEECCKGQDAVITIVGYPKDVEEVYFGEKGILNSCKKGTYLIDMTTTSPKLSERIFAAAKEKGAKALDAPVSGGDIGAKNGTLAIMVGGEKEDFEAVLPILEAMGSNIVYEGKPGSGQHTKMANQIAIAGAVSGVCEAIEYCLKTGLDIDTVLNTIATGAAGSWQLSNMGPKMANRDFAPGFFIKHFIKDMKIAMEEMQDRQKELTVLKTVCGIYEGLEEKGWGDLGTQAIIKYLEEE